VIHKAKIESLKQRLVGGGSGGPDMPGEGDRMGELRQQMNDEIQFKEIQIAQMREEIDRKDGAITTLEE
jgi:hypothetical protein